MINLNYLISMFDTLENPSTFLNEQIDYYHHQLDNRRKKHRRLRQTDYHADLYATFEVITAPLVHRSEFTPTYIQWITSALNLFEGLQSN